MFFNIRFHLYIDITRTSVRTLKDRHIGHKGMDKHDCIYIHACTANVHLISIVRYILNILVNVYLCNRQRELS